jgi:hypothetical protein
MPMIKFNKIFKTLLLAVLLLHSSFGNAQDCPCPNIEMTDTEFGQDTLNYENLFVKSYGKEKHTKWIYFPKNYFVFLDSFFKEHDYPGVRFFFVSHGKKIDDDQQSRKDQILFMIEAGYESSYVNFGTLNSFHQKVNLFWDPKNNHVELNTRRNQGTPSRINPDHIILPDINAIKTYKKENPKFMYTKSVYTCKAQIQQIKAFLDINTTYKGVKVYFASYNGKKPCSDIDWADAKQFTLILVPVIDQNSKASLKEYITYLKNLKEKFNTDYYNHGSLCPNSCP